MFSKPEISSWKLRFETDAPQALTQYSIFLGSIANLYNLIITLQVSKYFSQRWLRNEALKLDPTHELRLVSLTRASPDDAKLQGLASGMKALGDALSIGKQYQDIRTAGEKIREAKAQARLIELEVEKKEGELRLAKDTEAEEIRLVIAKKRSDQRFLQIKIEEEELRLRRLKREDADETLVFLQKHAPILEKLPENLRNQILLELMKDKTTVQESDFNIIEYKSLQ